MSAGRLVAFTFPLLLVAWIGLPFQEPIQVAPEEWILDLVQGGRPLVLALAAFEPRKPELADMASEISRVLRADLDFASLYRIADSGESTGAGADLVVTGALGRDSSGLVCEVRMRAVKSQKTVFATEYRAPLGAARHLAHRIADDVVVHDLLTQQVTRLTSGRGLNESPSWAPNGRHLAFSSTRTGEPQIFTINRDGSNLKQLTFEGRNITPSWGYLPR